MEAVHDKQSFLAALDTKELPRIKEARYWLFRHITRRGDLDDKKTIRAINFLRQSLLSSLLNYQLDHKGHISDNDKEFIETDIRSLKTILNN